MDNGFQIMGTKGCDDAVNPPVSTKRITGFYNSNTATLERMYSTALTAVAANLTVSMIVNCDADTVIQFCIVEDPNVGC
jgi:hypothetical protein